MGCKVRIDVILIRMARIARAFWYRARTRPDILGKSCAALTSLALRGTQGAGRFLLGPRSEDGHEHEVGDDYEEEDSHAFFP